jgi:hypothetical protein
MCSRSWSRVGRETISGCPIWSKEEIIRAQKVTSFIATTNGWNQIIASRIIFSNFRRTALTPSSGEDREHIYTPRYSNAVLPEEEEEEDEDDMDYISERYIGGDMRSKSSYGVSRESPVVGLRQRGMRGSTSFR